jgi:hypothetical protein
MKNLYLLIVFAILITSCSKNDNPVTSGTGTSTLIYERNTVDSINSGNLDYITIHNNFDYTGADSIVFEFTANSNNVAVSSNSRMELHADRYIDTIWFVQIYPPVWKYGVNDYRVAFPSPKRQWNNNYYRLLTANGNYLAIHKLRITKK